MSVLPEIFRVWDLGSGDQRKNAENRDAVDAAT